MRCWRSVAPAVTETGLAAAAIFTIWTFVRIVLDADVTRWKGKNADAARRIWETGMYSERSGL